MWFSRLIDEENSNLKSGNLYLYSVFSILVLEIKLFGKFIRIFV